jgi:hypothetical protein
LAYLAAAANEEPADGSAATHENDATTSAAPLSLSGCGRCRQNDAGYADDAGNLKPDAAHSVRQDHGHDGQSTKQEGPQLHDNVPAHGVTLSFKNAQV